MKSRAGFACGYLGWESDVEAVFVAEIPDDPLCQYELVGCIFGGNRKKFYLILLVDGVVEREISYFRVSILYLSSGLCYVWHALCAQVIEFGKGCRFVIAFLVGSGVGSVAWGDDIIFKFAHGFKFHASDITECLASFVKGVFGWAFKRLSVFVKIRTQHRYRRYLGKRIAKCGAVSRQYVEVAASRLDEGEQAWAVDSFATCQYGVKIAEVVDYEIERFQSSVTGRVHEVYHFDSFGFDIMDYVGFGKLLVAFL